MLHAWPELTFCWFLIICCTDITLTWVICMYVGKFRKVSILIVMLFNIQIKAIFRDPRSGTFLLLSELENFYVIQSLLNTSHYRQVKAQHPFFLSPLLRDFIFEFWFCMLKCWNAFLFLFLPLHHSWHSLTLDLGMERNV